MLLLLAFAGLTVFHQNGDQEKASKLRIGYIVGLINILYVYRKRRMYGHSCKRKCEYLIRSHFHARYGIFIRLFSGTVLNLRNHIF